MHRVRQYNMLGQGLVVNMGGEGGGVEGFSQANVNKEFMASF